MASTAFQAVGNQPTQPQIQQNPRNAAINRMRQMGIDIPQGMENDPNALIQHVMQSGKVPGNRLNMAQQVMRYMFKR